MGKPAISFPTGYSRVRLEKDIADTDLGLYRTNPLFEKYAKILANPWDAEPCGIATGSPCASQVYRNFSQGTFVTGSQRFGGISVSPSMANDQVSLVYTTIGPYAGVGLPGPSAGAATGVAEDSFSQLPYATSSFAPHGDAANTTAVVGRVVAMALRVTNTTSALNRAGKVRLGQTPFGTCVGQNFNNRQDLAQGTAFQEAASDRTLEIRWQTNAITDLEYNYYDTTAQERSLPLTYKNSSINKPLPTLYAMALSDGATDQTYDWQVVTIVEYAGFVQTGIPISGATRKLNDAAQVLSLRQSVVGKMNDLSKSAGDNPAAWLTRQGDRLMNVLFDRPINDPTGRQSGTTVDLIKDVFKVGLGLRSRAKKPKNSSSKQLVIA